MIYLLSTICLLGVACLFSGCAEANQVEPESPARTADIAILYTGDVHCAVSENIGYAGLAAYKQELEADGCEVLLVDSGDAVQGAAIGSFSKGESIIKLMNHLGYCAMAIGNHEFDYGGPESLAELAGLAEFPLLSVNFRAKSPAFASHTEKAAPDPSSDTGKRTDSGQFGTPWYQEYVLVERDGVTLAFLGVSAPQTISSSTPAYFMDEEGTIVYDFMADGTGETLWKAVQDSVDAAREEGADYVIALTHLGIEDLVFPYTSSELIAHTSGIDVVLDGHSHSVIECERVKNKEGNRVLLSATGTRLEHIGLLLLDKNGSLSTGLVSEVAGRDTEIEAMIADLQQEYEETLRTVVARLDASLTIDDPETGVRIIRNAETNLGDLCADAYRAAGAADIGFVNGGGIRASLPAGEITQGDILAVNPFGNLLCKVRVSGQTILDALEFGARAVPEENGGFLQVSGLTYEIRTDLASSVQTDENGLFVSVDGPYRVQNVQIGGQPLELDREYTLVSHSYMLKSCGDGYTMFSGCEVLIDEFIVDAEALSQYLATDYPAQAGRYEEAYGEGRIQAAE